VDGRGTSGRKRIWLLILLKIEKEVGVQRALGCKEKKLYVVFLWGWGGG